MIYDEIPIFDFFLDFLHLFLLKIIVKSYQK